MNIQKKSITKPTRIRCENEREEGYFIRVQFPTEPDITTQQTRLGLRRIIAWAVLLA